MRTTEGFPGCSVAKNLPANSGDARDLGLNLGLGRSTGEGNGIPHQYSCLENPMDRGAWCATVHAVTELDVIELTHNRTRLGIILLSLQITWKTSLIIFQANALWFIYDPTNKIKFSRICKTTSHTEIELHLKDCWVFLSSITFRITSGNAYTLFNFN